MQGRYEAAFYAVYEYKTASSSLVDGSISPIVKRLEAFEV
jgi:hypothetical protein